MIESVVYIHSKGVRHSDLRLEQWLVDLNFNVRLSDFNAAGFDDQPDLGMKGRPAQGLEVASHCLPRDLEADNTVISDLFALGSTLYELLTREVPFEGQSDEFMELSFREGNFPSTEGLLLGEVIMGCWKQIFSSAEEVLDHGKNMFGSGQI
jgi:serine/threonine protein kinase